MDQAAADWYEQRTAKLAADFQALPLPAKLFAAQWRRCVELCGRTAGDKEREMCRFVADLQRLIEELRKGET